MCYKILYDKNTCLIARSEILTQFGECDCLRGCWARRTCWKLTGTIVRAQFHQIEKIFAYRSTTIRYFFFTRGTSGVLPGLGFRSLGRNPFGGNKVPYFQMSPDTRHRRVQHKGHASLACLADALNLLYNKWFRRVRGPAATQATRHLWYVNYFTHLILVTWVWAACGYAGYLWLNDLFNSALPSENDVYVPPTRRTDCVVTNQQNTLTDVDTMSVSSTRRVFTLSHALTHSEPIDRPSDAISDSPTRIRLVAGCNAALSSISCSFQKHIYILSSFQRCATVFKSMALVSFRSTNKVGTPRIR